MRKRHSRLSGRFFVGSFCIQYREMPALSIRMALSSIEMALFSIEDGVRAEVTDAG
jgi:hypothetical protein